MASSWLFRPLPLRERGRTSQLDPSDKALGRAQPPSPQPSPAREREPEVPSAKGVIANSTVLALARGTHATGPPAGVGRGGAPRFGLQPVALSHRSGVSKQVMIIVNNACNGSDPGYNRTMRPRALLREQQCCGRWELAVRRFAQPPERDGTEPRGKPPGRASVTAPKHAGQLGPA